MNVNSRERVLAALSHQEPDRVPVDFGSSSVTGIHVSCVAALRAWYGLEPRLVKVAEPGQMLGTLDDDLKDILGLDVEPIPRAQARFGFPLRDWKPWRMPDGLEVLVPGGFVTTTAPNGDVLLHPQGDLDAAPSSRMPFDGYFFDDIIRQPPIDEDHLDPQDNLEEYGPVSETALEYFREAAPRSRATGRAVMASFGGTALGDIATIPGAGLKHPRGIRSIDEWYMSINVRRPFVHAMFDRQCEIALANLSRIREAVGDSVDVVYVCGTDFGTQESAFCSVATFRDLWLPYYRRINQWIHAHTSWRTFKHSCGSVRRFVPLFIEAGFDILNPVQCSARNMDPRELKAEFGKDVVFWGGGVDTQRTLPFGTPEEVRRQVLERCEILAPGGGFVFNTIHNVQARTPVENIVAMFEAIREFHTAGSGRAALPAADRR